MPVQRWPYWPLAFLLFSLFHNLLPFVNAYEVPIVDTGAPRARRYRSS